MNALIQKVTVYRITHFCFIKFILEAYKCIQCRLFTVPYFSLRSLQLNALHYWQPSWMSVKSTWGLGDSLKGSLPLPTTLDPNACPLGTLETKMAVVPVSALSWTSDDLMKK